MFSKLLSFTKIASFSLNWNCNNIVWIKYCLGSNKQCKFSLNKTVLFPPHKLGEIASLIHRMCMIDEHSHHSVAHWLVTLWSLKLSICTVIMTFWCHEWTSDLQKTLFPDTRPALKQTLILNLFSNLILSIIHLKLTTETIVLIVIYQQIVYRGQKARKPRYPGLHCAIKGLTPRWPLAQLICSVSLCESVQLGSE